MPNIKLPLAILVFLLGLAIAIAALWLTKSNTGSPQSAVGGPFSLIDDQGSIVTDQNLIGKPTLIFFGFTYCPDVCPTKLLELSQILTKLGNDAARINVYFVTVDPDRDTKEVMANYVSSFHPTIRGLTGDQAAIDKTIKAYRAYARKAPLSNGDYTMDHSAVVYLMDKTGRFIAPFNLERPPEDAAQELRRYL